MSLMELFWTIEGCLASIWSSALVCEIAFFSASIALHVFGDRGDMKAGFEVHVRFLLIVTVIRE